MITVFTSPTPPRAGMVDVSVLVQDATTNMPRLDVPVEVSATRDHEPARVVHATATAENATNKLFQAAWLELPEPGLWNLDVVVGSEHAIRIPLVVEAPLPGWLPLAGWIGWPAVAIVLFAIHRKLKSRRRPRDLS